ncbi:MAG: ChaN family lipoprotein [Flavobacteriaceae bacterium]
MKKNLFLLCLFLISLGIQAQKKEAYQIFNAKGKKVSYKKMLKTAAKNDVVFFGEFHNNAIAHWLQYELTNDLNQDNKLALGAEMFERDNQKQLDQYLLGSINEKALDSTARLWPNFDTDYKPLLDYAKDHKLAFIATNVPRSYASLVYKGGFEALDTLSSKEKNWIAPLPIAFDPELETYKNILKMMGGHGSEKLVMAQAIKDATMAYSISENLKEDEIFIHYNGSYHSDFHEGILWYLMQMKPQAKLMTISTVSQENIYKLDKEFLNKADFIIVVDKNMTNTY